jgi:hypothetical protein
MDREELDAQAAFERLRWAARSSARRLADVANDVTAGQPLPASGRHRASSPAVDRDLAGRVRPGG